MAATAPCPGCNGTGQITYFGGVSRFLLSHEECPECYGTGLLATPQGQELTAKALAQASSLTLQEAQRFLQVLSSLLRSCLARGERVELRGFGTFSLTSDKNQPDRLCFKPGSRLTRALNEPES